MRIPTYSSRVQVLDPGAIPQPGARPSSGITSAISQISGAIGKIAGAELKSLGRIEAKRKDDEAAALVVSSEAAAFEDWSEHLNTIRSKHRKDPTKATFSEISAAKNSVMTDFTQHADEWIFDRITSAPTPESKLALTESLGKFRFDMIKQTIKEETKTTKELYKGALKNGLDYESVRMQADPENWKEFYDAGLAKIKASGSTFLSPMDTFIAAKDFDLSTARSVANSWFETNGSKIGDLEALRTGEFKDPDINKLWEHIPSKQRHSMYVSTVNEHLKKLNLADRVQKDREEEIKKNTDNLILDFYDPSVPMATKSNIMFTLKTIGQITAPQYIKMQQDLAGDAAVSDSNAILALKLDIADGRVTSYKELLNSGIDANSISNVVIPFFESHRDESFKEATSFLRSELGMPPGVLEFLDPKVNRRAELRALSDLTKFRHTTPAGDFFTEAERLVGEFHKVKKAEHDASIERLKTKRDVLLEAGKNEDADALQRRIDALGAR